VFRMLMRLHGAASAGFQFSDASVTFAPSVLQPMPVPATGFGQQKRYR
jgi:hypothetical protein